MESNDFIIHFPIGIPGFPEHTSFRLLESPDSYPLKFLQSMVDPGVSFSCMDAAAVKLDYEVPLAPEEAETLALEAPEDALVLAIVAVPADAPDKLTANLAGPLVINTRTHTGRQVVLDPSVYSLAHRVILPREERELQFPAGLIGYPDLKRFRLLEPQDGYPLKFLQSTEQETVSFVCIDVSAVKPDYVVPMSDEDAQSLAIENPDDALILALVVLPEDPSRMTANLAGPLVVNVRTLQARQIVLNIDQFPLAYPIFSGK
jgi:flagellar assembly factor FliW